MELAARPRVHMGTRRLLQEQVSSSFLKLKEGEYEERMPRNDAPVKWRWILYDSVMSVAVPHPSPTPAPTTDPTTNPAPGSAAGLTAGTATRECTFARFLKCNPTSFHGNEGAVGLSRWIEKSESVFDISKCAEGNKVIFATATLQDSTITWWNNHVASMGRAVANSKSWTEMKAMMTEEFCPPEEIQRM
ncbi:hypothetical protein Tco_0903346 [Tanacetum coccineum]